ncbi:MAG: hybrid sensor histidine kinase/response regulator [Desulfobacteraceae bacterium]|nr:hybrid sensor histidine kinase/response regulator [Desulfobacteraceae bacterium]
MYFSSIKVKLTLIFCLIYTISFFIIFQFTSSRIKETLEKNILEKNLQKTIELSGKMADALKWGNWATIEVTLKSRFKQNPDWLFVLVRDKNGELAVSTDDTLIEDAGSHYLPEFNMASSKTMTLSSDPWKSIQLSIHYQLTTIAGDIIHNNDIISSKGETIFDAYIQITRNKEILGSVRAGFSRRALTKDIRQLKLFLITIEIAALLLSFFLMIAVFSNMLKDLTELARELSKISHADNPNELLSQLQAISIDKINVKTHELKELKKASLRFQQQLVLNIEQAEKYSHMERHARTMEDIAKTTQMLAHDIRKPLSMILMIMQTLQDCTEPREIQAISKKFLPEMQSAITAANDMIDDIMEIDRAQRPKIKPIDPLVVIKKSLREISRIYPTAQIDIEYALNHRHMINADELKLQRVFSNIFSNAAQAMNKTGALRISAHEDTHKQMTTFCIENNGAYLPKDELSKVFDAFYTKHKENGTGLGLAISKRIIMAHGGEIWCESFRPEMVVKFCFTIPIAAQNPANAYSVGLPLHLNELSDEYELKSKSRITAQGITVSDPKQLSSEKTIHKYYKQNGKKLKLCILDDELIYQIYLVELIKKSQLLNCSIDISLAKNHEEVSTLFAQNTPDLLICDIDLGPDCLDGFQIVSKLRKSGYKQAVCMHSNLSLLQDCEASIRAGAQAILPKPMPLEHLITFIFDSLPAITSQPIAGAKQPPCPWPGPNRLRSQ